MPYSVVPVNPKTGTIVTRPRRNQEVVFYSRGPRGGMKRLSRQSQPYLKADHDGLNAQIKNTKGGNFVIYEQLTPAKYSEADYKAGLGKKKEIGIHKTKITGPKPRNKQRPLFYVRGNARRALDLGFKKGNKVKPKERGPVQVLTTGTPERIAKTHMVELHGATIKEALAGVQVDTILSQVKDKILYYTLKLRVYEPDGKGGYKAPVDIPASGSIVPGQAEYVGDIPIDGKMHEGVRDKVPILANVKTQIAKTVRYALKDQGIRYTRPVKLKQIASADAARIGKMESQADRLPPGGDRDKMEKKIENAWDAHDGIKRMGQTWADSPGLKQAGKNWKIEMYINFEIAG